ncbi:MAG: hypothetical protein Ct9H90mP16_01690 [Candidatus Poseidoniales archaeon]|nr:MAG: hypothetical protein Ct9H90mP16_01690 [Candidatus Poseidoniales archaeon]
MRLIPRNPHGWGNTLAEFPRNASGRAICWFASDSPPRRVTPCTAQRCGALVLLHPNRAFIKRLLEVMFHTGRGLGRGGSLPQPTLHSFPFPDVEKFFGVVARTDPLQQMLTKRRQLFNDRWKRKVCRFCRALMDTLPSCHTQTPEPIAQAAAPEGCTWFPQRGHPHWPVLNPHLQCRPCRRYFGRSMAISA